METNDPEVTTTVELDDRWESTYKRLAAPFEKEFHDVRGGVQITYITGEQCTSRLNEVLGFLGWSFRVLEHGYNQEADEMWSLGELVASIEGQQVVRQQFGSQKLKRSRTTDAPLDIGFDLKGATTDALKKCASLIGVGLYLYEKEGGAEHSADANPVARGTREAIARESGQVVSLPHTGEAYTCEQCDEELKEIKFRDGTVWTPALLASYGRRKHGRVLCMQHYREANESRKKSEQTPSEEIPF